MEAEEKWKRKYFRMRRFAARLVRELGRLDPERGEAAGLRLLADAAELGGALRVREGCLVTATNELGESAEYVVSLADGRKRDIEGNWLDPEGLGLIKISSLGKDRAEQPA